MRGPATNRAAVMAPPSVPAESVNMDVCPICLEPPKDAMITRCQHVFCEVCILDWAAKRKASYEKLQKKLDLLECPMCNRGLKRTDVRKLESDQQVVRPSSQCPWSDEADTGPAVIDGEELGEQAQREDASIESASAECAPKRADSNVTDKRTAELLTALPPPPSCLAPSATPLEPPSGPPPPPPGPPPRPPPMKLEDSCGTCEVSGYTAGPEVDGTANAAGANRRRGRNKIPPMILK